jgi:hypothetical protein
MAVIIGTRNVIISSVGRQGPPGPQGPSGDSGGIQRVTSFFSGNGSQTVFNLTHNLGTKYTLMSFWLTNLDVTDEPVLVDWQPINATTARVTFPASRPLASGWRIDWLAIG